MAWYLDGKQQSVSIDRGAIIPRVIYGRIDNPEIHIQVGYVQINDKHVLVWRPWDLADKSSDASWRSGVWKNIYTMRMRRHLESNRIRIKLESLDFDGREISLPIADMKLSAELQEHIRGRLT